MSAKADLWGRYCPSLIMMSRDSWELDRNLEEGARLARKRNDGNSFAIWKIKSPRIYDTANSNSLLSLSASKFIVEEAASSEASRGRAISSVNAS